MRANALEGAWEILQSKYQGNARVKLIKLKGLKREFENLKIKESKEVEQYSSRLTELVNRMRAHREEETDQIIFQ